MMMVLDDDDAPQLPVSVPVNSERAPFLYFDGVMTYASTAGQVQLELGANTAVPTADGGIRSEVVITAHLRCSQAAARILRDSIDKALAIAERAADGARLAAAQAGPAALAKRQH
jgi:hypothetical protein